MFRASGTRGWMMESGDGKSMEAWLEMQTRETLGADPDPTLISQLIETGRAEVKG